MSDPKQFTDRNSTPLSVTVEQGELIIRIGIETLEFCSRPENGGPLVKCKVDARRRLQFTKDVAYELERQEGDGTTPLAFLLDAMMIAAAHAGSSALIYEKNYDPKILRSAAKGMCVMCGIDPVGGSTERNGVNVAICYDCYSSDEQCLTAFLHGDPAPGEKKGMSWEEAEKKMVNQKARASRRAWAGRLRLYRIIRPSGKPTLTAEVMLPNMTEPLVHVSFTLTDKDNTATDWEVVL